MRHATLLTSCFGRALLRNVVICTHGGVCCRWLGRELLVARCLQRDLRHVATVRLEFDYFCAFWCTVLVCSSNRARSMATFIRRSHSYGKVLCLTPVTRLVRRNRLSMQVEELDLLYACRWCNGPITSDPGPRRAYRQAEVLATRAATFAPFLRLNNLRKVVLGRRELDLIWI